jgi:hypothetical protein
MGVITWVAQSLRRISPSGLSSIYKLGPIADGVDSLDAVNVRQLRSVSSGADAFAASVQSWGYRSPHTGEPIWTPQGLWNFSVSAPQMPQSLFCFALVTLNRGTQWGNVTVNASISGTGIKMNGPSTITIHQGQCQGALSFSASLFSVGVSVLTLEITDGVHTETRTLTLNVIAPAVSGGYYGGGSGLGERLI